MNFIMSLDAETFIELIEKSIERDNDKVRETLLHRWGYELPFMENSMQFEDYRDLALGIKPPINKVIDKKNTNTERLSDKSNDEILKRIEEVRKLDQARNSGGENL